MPSVFTGNQEIICSPGLFKIQDAFFCPIELVQVKNVVCQNISHESSAKTARGLQRILCGERVCKVENNLSPIRPCRHF